jgi:hypothetical protein
MKTLKGVLTVILAVLVIAVFAGMAMAEPYHILSNRDVVGTYGKDGKSARVGFINATCMEGTSNAYETCIYAVDPTSDNELLMPDASGTLATTDGTFSGTVSIADGKVLIGNSGGEGVAVTPSGDWTITNSGVSSLGSGVVNSNEIEDGSITDTDMGWLTETLVIASGATSNTTASSAIYNGTLFVQPWQNTTDAYIINTTMAVDGTATVVVNGTLGADYSVQVTRTKP